MNQFKQAANSMLALHGVTCTYTKLINGTYDPNTGSVTNSETTSSIKAYKKHLKATQFNYPSLIGKNAAMVYISADSIVGTPNPNDKFTFGTEVFTVESVQEHSAGGEVCLYRVVCVKV